MFTFDATVDAIQTGKKTLVHVFVHNEEIRSAMVKFIDAQSEYTKKAIKAGTDAATVIASASSKSAQDLMKFDYSKFGEGIMKAYTAQTSSK